MYKKIQLFLIMAIVLFSGIACQFSSEIIDATKWSSPSIQQSQVVSQNDPITSNDPDIEDILQQIPTPVLPQDVPVQPEPPDDRPISEKDNILVGLYEYASPGVVTILTLTEEGSGLGSGFVYDKEGHIITNYHVVEGSTDLEVDFPSGLKSRGQVIGTDIDSDLAVIKINVPSDYLTPLPLGDSDQLKVGQTVVAIGNPFRLSGTMTMGIISAKGRTFESSRQADAGGYFSAGDIIQTDASINPGNSGGPLLNIKGEVIGINYMIRTTGTSITGDPVNSGIGFAISSNIVKRVVPEIIVQGYYEYPYIGITSREELPLLLQEQLGITQTWGAYVIEVVPGSPAHQAGLLGGSIDVGIPGILAGGDIIIGVDDREVKNFGDFLSYIMTNKSPGDQITLTIIRDNQNLSVPVTLGKRQ